jgi:hypothetical protein
MWTVLMKRQEELGYRNRSSRGEGYKSSKAWNPLPVHLGSLTNIVQKTPAGANVWKDMSNEYRTETSSQM